MKTKVEVSMDYDEIRFDVWFYVINDNILVVSIARTYRWRDMLQIDALSLQIKKNEDLLREIEKLTSKIEVQSDNKRNMMYFGFCRTALSHYLSIGILTEKKLHNSAFALVRVLFDSVVRALYLYHFFAKDDIDKMYDGEADFPKTEFMCKKLDTMNSREFFEDMRKRVYGAMCDYTHTGSNQVARNFNEAKGTIESNFNDALILDMLIGILALVDVLALDFFEEVGLKQKNIIAKDISNYVDNRDKILK